MKRVFALVALAGLMTFAVAQTDGQNRLPITRDGMGTQTGRGQDEGGFDRLPIQKDKENGSTTQSTQMVPVVPDPPISSKPAVNPFGEHPEIQKEVGAGASAPTTRPRQIARRQRNVSMPARESFSASDHATGSGKPKASAAPARMAGVVGKPKATPSPTAMAYTQNANNVLVALLFFILAIGVVFLLVYTKQKATHESPSPFRAQPRWNPKKR